MFDCYFNLGFNVVWFGLLLVFSVFSLLRVMCGWYLVILFVWGVLFVVVYCLVPCFVICVFGCLLLMFASVWLLVCTCGVCV